MSTLLGLNTSRYSVGRIILYLYQFFVKNTTLFFPFHCDADAATDGTDGTNPLRQLSIIDLQINKFGPYFRTVVTACVLTAVVTEINKNAFLVYDVVFCFNCCCFCDTCDIYAL